MKKLVFYFDPTVTKMFVEKTNESGEKSVVLSSPHNFVYRAEIVARVINVDDEDEIKTLIDPDHNYYNVVNYVSLKIDQGLYFDEQTKSYKAAYYGFVIYSSGSLRLLSAFSITRDRLKAYYLVHPTKFGKIPSSIDIEEEMKVYKILAGIGQKKIEEQLLKINENEKKVTKVLLAKGKDAVNGHEEYFIPIIDLKKKAGELLEDGSIDYKEVGSIIQVNKDQELLRRIPAVKPESGYNIYGDKVPAEIMDVSGLKRGENIVQSGHDKNIFCAAIDGCIVVDSNVISVLPIAYINGDINYDTGNIDFNGSVHITGSVLPGFSVKASGDIIVEKAIEDAILIADGDITVKMGVVGKESVKIMAGGKLTAKYLLNTKVEAEGEVIVQDSIINCNVFSNDKISVVAKAGKIIGGESTALHEIIVKVSGAPNETETILKVGRNLHIERELRELRAEVSKIREVVNETMRLLKVNFGEGVFENPKKYISILPDIKKRKCLELLRELSAGNKELKELTEKIAEVQKGLKLEREPMIIITNKAYPGTVLNIRKSVRKIETLAHNVKYFEDPEEKIIRFTSAV